MRSNENMLQKLLRTKLVFIALLSGFFMTSCSLFERSPKSSSSLQMSNKKEIGDFIKKAKQNPRKFIRSIRINQHFIKRITSEIQSSGEQNVGIYRVEINRPDPVILKLGTHFISETQLAKSFAFQMSLSILQMAPRVYGVLYKSPLKKFVARYSSVYPPLRRNLKRVNTEPVYGLLMEKIKDSVLVTAFNEVDLRFAKSWDLGKIKKRMKEVASICNEFNIDMNHEVEFLVSKDSKVYLIDLDLYYERRAEGDNHVYVDRVIKNLENQLGSS